MTDPQIAEVAEVARRADVAIVVARDFQTEALDRAGSRLPSHQDELVEAVAEANPRTVVVLEAGGPVTMPWVSRVPAIIAAWYGGERGVAALASVLCGDVNPSGKLPITFPRTMEDLPTTTVEQYPGVGKRVLYSEGLEVGYRH